MKLRSVFLLLGLLLSAGYARGQQPLSDSLSFGEVVDGLFRLQEFYFPQEKAHLHLDRNHYISGDTIWIRGYLVNSITHIPDYQSRHLFIDLVDPADSVFLRAKIRRQNGAWAGYLALPEDAREGNYTLRAYTLFMRNAGEEYFFQTPVRISDPESIKMKMDISLSFPEPRNRNLMTAEIEFKRISDNTPLYGKEITIGIGNRKRETVYSTREGLFTSSLQLPTRNKRNVLRIDYEKSVRYFEIPPPEDVFSVSFFPEGGYLVAGATCRVGFKSINAYGTGEDVSGKIVTEEGETVVTFKSVHRGMGGFYFVPEAGKKYYAECLNSEEYLLRVELPEVRSDIPSLRVVQREERLIVSVNKPAGFKPDGPLHLIMHTRGAVGYSRQIGNAAQPVYIDPTVLPSGITSILLMDENRNILSERLIFCLNDDQAKVGFSAPKSAYASRVRVERTISLTDPQGLPLQGAFSVAVTDNNDVLPDTTANILTNLLISSDLKGYVEAPAWYFSGEEGAFGCLDYLMLTQGWRRYDVPELMQGKLKHTDVKLENEIAGRVQTILSRKLLPDMEITMFGKAGIFEEKTNKDGYFAFNNIDFPDSTHFFVQALTKKGDDKIELLIEPDYQPSLRSLVPFYPKVKSENYSSYDYAAKAELRWTIENGERLTILDAATVIGKAKGTTYTKYAYANFDEKYFKENEIATLEDFMYSQNEIDYDGGDTIRFLFNTTRSGDVIFVIDDFIMDSTFEWRRDLNFRDIKSIGLVNATLAGAITMDGASPGPAGAFIITTKYGWGNRVPNRDYNKKLIAPLGYQKPVEFYSPKYETPAQRNSKKPDLRTTIYWNPNLRTDENGIATFDFYTADAATNYSIVIEGITDDGKIIRAEDDIRRK